MIPRSYKEKKLKICEHCRHAIRIYNVNYSRDSYLVCLHDEKDIPTFVLQFEFDNDDSIEKAKCFYAWLDDREVSIYGTCSRFEDKEE